QAPLVAPEVNQAHVVTMEKVSNSEIHCYLDGVLNDTFEPTNIVRGPVTSFTNSVTVKLWVEGGVNGANDNGFSSAPVAAIVMYSPALSSEDRTAQESEL